MPVWKKGGILYSLTLSVSLVIYGIGDVSLDIQFGKIKGSIQRIADISII